MKQSTSTAIVLTLLMLLLVLGAAFVFSYQSQQTLMQQAAILRTSEATLQSSAAQTSSQLTDETATRTAVAEILATTEAEQIMLEGQLVERQQEIETLTGDLTNSQTQLDDVAAALNQIEQQRLAQRPLVSLILPQKDVVFLADEPVDFVIAASDLNGVNRVDLVIDGETTSFPTGNVLFYTNNFTHTFSEVGGHEVTVTAVNVNQLTSDPVTTTFGIIPNEAALQSRIAGDIQALRDQSPLEAAPAIFISQPELKQWLANTFTNEAVAKDGQQKALVLSMFDFVPSGADLSQALPKLTESSFTGLYYDPETDKFYTVNASDTFGPLEQWLYAREVAQGQQNIASGTDSLDFDARIAYDALTKGELALVQGIFLNDTYLPPQELAALQSTLTTLETDVLDGLPTVLREQLLFPYQQGFQYAYNLYKEGGIEMLENARINPPQSSEQVLHPILSSAAAAPQIVTLPDLTSSLGEGWLLLEEDVLGEFRLRQYLRQRLPASEVDTAVSGWGGDRYAVYARETDGGLVLVLRLTWDEVESLEDFAIIYPGYATAVYGDDGAPQADGSICWQDEDTLCLYTLNDESLLVRAPNRETVTAVIQTIE